MNFFGDLPIVFSFYSMSLFKYIRYSMMVLMLFILFIFLSVPLYIAILKTTGDFRYFIPFPFLFIISYRKLRQKVFLKNQLKLNLSFVDFLEQRKGKKPEGDIEVSDDALSHADRTINETLLKSNSSKILLAIRALLIYPGTTMAFKKVTWKFRDKNLGRFSYRGIEIFLFILLLLPFLAIAVLMTWGKAFIIQSFIFFLGLMFVGFSQALIIEPIIFLLTLKNLWDQID